MIELVLCMKSVFLGEENFWIVTHKDVINCIFFQYCFTVFEFCRLITLG